MEKLTAKIKVDQSPSLPRSSVWETATYQKPGQPTQKVWFPRMQRSGISEKSLKGGE